jgi:uncharacterized protein YndB with AHSA1/START domain
MTDAPDKIEAKVTHRFAASPETLFEAMTDPAQVERWQKAWLVQGGLPGEMTRCEIDPREGGAFLYADLRDGEEARHWGRFLTLERPHKIRHTWIVDADEEDDPSIVTIVIEPAPEGTGSVVTLYHEMDAQWAEYRERTEKGWSTMLAAIETVLDAPAA